MAYSTCNVFRNRHNSHSLTASYRSRYYALSKVPRHSLNTLKAFFCGGGGGGGERGNEILFHTVSSDTFVEAWETWDICIIFCQCG